MNELFQIQPQWARARCLRSNPLAIGVEMPDRPMRAERPFTPLLLLLAIVYLMAVLTPTSASAARLDSAEALAAWAKSKNWTKTSYGIGYKSDKINSFDIWIVYDRTPTLIPVNESWESGGRNPEAVTRTGENITIAGGIPATLLYTSIVHEDRGHEFENWEYYCHDYRVLMRAHRDTQIGQAGSDPLALLENYIAFVNKYLNVKPPKDLKAVRILLWMPKTEFFQKRSVLVYGPGKPGFKIARASGQVIFDWWEKWDYAREQKIYILLFLDKKRVRYLSGKTDKRGRYTFDLEVNKKGKNAVRVFQKDFKIRAIKLSGKYHSVPGQDQKKVIPASLKKNIPSKREWKDAFWKSASHLNAIMKDIAWAKSGGKGTPNVVQWQKNYNAGRHSANALKLLIDVATGPATASSQVLENAANTYFAITGKKLPFDKNSKKNAIKHAGLSTLDMIIWKRNFIEGKVTK